MFPTWPCDRVVVVVVAVVVVMQIMTRELRMTTLISLLQPPPEVFDEVGCRAVLSTTVAAILVSAASLGLSLLLELFRSV
jgi:hypothetical protein